MDRVPALWLPMSNILNIMRAQNVRSFVSGEVFVRVAGGGMGDAVMPAIRNQIRELRAAQKMTQQELADRVGVTRQTVIAMEQDKYSPSLETAFRVAMVLGVTLEQCFQYEPHGKR